jgi:hypothetical protein
MIERGVVTRHGVRRPRTLLVAADFAPAFLVKLERMFATGSRHETDGAGVAPRSDGR